MTLHVYENLEQGSDEWLAARCGMLTASTIGKLITPTLKVADNDTSRGLTLTLAAERITGHVEYVHPSFDMMRGTEDEPVVRDLYVEHHAPVAQVGFMVRDFDGFSLGYSPDGLVNEDGLLEIKSRNPKVQIATILAGDVPRANYAQLQAGLLISGRDWIDYASYSGGLPLWTKRVFPDPAWFEAILAAAESFEKAASEVIQQFESATAGMPTTERLEHFIDSEITF